MENVIYLDLQGPANQMEESFTPSYDDGKFDFNGIVVETDDRYDDDDYDDE